MVAWLGPTGHPRKGDLSLRNQTFYKENPGLATPVVIRVHALDLEPERAVERDRALVYRRGDRAHDRAGLDRCKEALVERAAEARTAPLGIDAHEEDVRLVGVRL